MSDQTPNGIPTGAPEGGNIGPQPILLNLQYTKDLSFEVPGAPEIFATLREQPKIDLALDVQAKPLPGGPNLYEVSLNIRADAKAQGQSAFIAELVYCGIFTITVDENMLEPVLLVECPRLLFPFARNILADITRDGGFPPVLLTPIDFVALWQSRAGRPWRTPEVLILGGGTEGGFASPGPPPAGN